MKGNANERGRTSQLRENRKSVQKLRRREKRSLTLLVGKDFKISIEKMRLSDVFISMKNSLAS